jgi:hypothetical protein
MVELEDIVKKYPWYAAAYRQMYLKMRQQGVEYSSNMMRRAAPYMYSCKELFKQGSKVVVVKQKIDDAPVLEKPVIEVEKVRDVFIVGGDYFGRDEYQQLKDAGENVFDVIKADFTEEKNVVAKVDKSNDQFSDDEYCTETLARIYVAQGCIKRAMEVYDKLILLYPEKNAYFAALKEEIKKQL